jgi:hypothetical protein
VAGKQKTRKAQQNKEEINKDMEMTKEERLWKRDNKPETWCKNYRNQPKNTGEKKK